MKVNISKSNHRHLRLRLNLPSYRYQSVLPGEEQSRHRTSKQQRSDHPLSEPSCLTFLLILKTQLLMLGVCACDWCSTVNTWPYFFERCCSGQKEGKVWKFRYIKNCFN